LGNVDPYPAEWSFEIDATPPVPVIIDPIRGEAVSADVDILGTASDLRFRDYVVELRITGTQSWMPLARETAPVTNDVLARFDSRGFVDGDYDLRLSVADTLGLVGTALSSLIIDNEEPWAHVTTPARVTMAGGGHVYTTNGEAHLYFPPGAFAEDAIVTVSELATVDVPDSLESGERWVVPGYEITWDRGSLLKTATLELSFAGEGETPVNGALAIYMHREDSGWQPVGGSINASSELISSPISEAGRYAISPRGSFANDRVAIGFTLERSGPVTVKIYDRAGRLVEEVASGEVMNAGANLIYWNGRDRNGDIVEDGLYMVTVRANERKETKTLAIVR
jgi:hypothetical protein